MSTNVKELTDQQASVITAMLAGVTQRDAAERVGVASETVSRWKHDPVFVAELNTRRREVWNAARSELEGLVKQAVATLGELLNEENPNVRLRATIAILDRHGLDKHEPFGPTTPERVERQWSGGIDFDDLFGFGPKD